jgi:hypothetical protein
MGKLIDLAAERARRAQAREQEGLALAFDSDHPEFTRGVEAGRLLSALQQMRCAGQPSASALLHVTNREMAARIAAAEGYEADFWATDDPEQIAATFTAQVAERRR